MTELQLHFLATNPPSMFLSHPEKAVLFDAPDGVHMPADPDAIFLTDHSEPVAKSAAVLADVCNVPVMGAGKFESDSLEIEPFRTKPRVAGGSKSYGYMIKSRGVNIAYAPSYREFPREVLGADIAILDGNYPNTIKMAKAAGISRIYLTNVNGQVAKSDDATYLEDGHVLTLVEKQDPTISKEDADYGEPTDETAGRCGDCRFYREMEAKSEWTTAYVNDLPASAFAIPGSRKYPHHNKEGGLDLPHLRNALARARQFSSGDAALAHLRAHAKSAKIGEFAKAYEGEVAKSEELEEFQKPVDTTENQIRVRVRSPSDFETGSFRTISLDADRGISAIIGKPKGKSSTATQAYRFARGKGWTAEKARSWAQSHGGVSKSEDGHCVKVIGSIDPSYTCDLYEPARLAPMAKFSFAKVRQPFGSPGGKRAMAKRLNTVIPPHTTYVEPYAGGAALYFSKSPSEREILNDLDTNIALAYKTMKNLSDADIRRLQRKNWTVSKAQFKKLQTRPPADGLGQLYSFLYKRGAAYGNYTQPSASHEGKIMKVAARLGEVRDRMKGTTILNSDALEIIRKTDSPDTFFYLDPPYPTEWKFDGNTGSADSDKWSGKDLRELFEVLKSVRGKFILSLEAEIAKVVPDEFHVTSISMPRQMSLGPKGKLTKEHEILVSNFDLKEVQKSQPDMGDVHVDSLMHAVKPLYAELDENTIVFAKSADSEKRLVWTVNMVPNKVDGEGHWQDEETIMKTAHEFMLKEIPIWSEHQKAVRGVFPVQSYTLISDLNVKKSDSSERTIPAGSWVTVLWVQNDEEWAKVKKGDYRGTSVRGFARKVPGSPPKDKRQEVV